MLKNSAWTLLFKNAETGIARFNVIFPLHSTHIPAFILWFQRNISVHVDATLSSYPLLLRAGRAVSKVTDGIFLLDATSRPALGLEGIETHSPEVKRSRCSWSLHPFSASVNNASSFISIPPPHCFMVYLRARTTSPNIFLALERRKTKGSQGMTDEDCKAEHHTLVQSAHEHWHGENKYIWAE